MSETLEEYSQFPIQTKPRYCSLRLCAKINLQYKQNPTPILIYSGFKSSGAISHNTCGSRTIFLKLLAVFLWVCLSVFVCVHSMVGVHFAFTNAFGFTIYGSAGDKYILSLREVNLNLRLRCGFGRPYTTLVLWRSSELFMVDALRRAPKVRDGE